MQFKTSPGSTGVTIGGTTYTPAANGIITVADSQVTSSLVTSFTALGILPYFADSGTTPGNSYAGTVSDTQSAPIGTATQLASGQSATPGRAFGYVCTSPGTLTLTLATAGSVSMPIPVSSTIVIMPFAVTQMVLSNGLAGTFWNLG